MINEVKMYAGQCDCCGEVCEYWHDRWTCLPDESAIEEMMTEQGWYIDEVGDDENRDMHYCPKCFKVDDEDTLIVDWSRKSEALSAPASPVEEKAEDIQQWIKREMAEYDIDFPHPFPPDIRGETEQEKAYRIHCAWYWKQLKDAQALIKEKQQWIDSHM